MDGIRIEEIAKEAWARRADRMASKALMALMALEKGVGVVEAKSREECCQGLANQASAPAMHVYLCTLERGLAD
jgi:hypothetical protein